MRSNPAALRKKKGSKMTKKEIYAVRGQVHGAMTAANNSKTQYSPLLRMEWKKYGYIPVSARFL